MPGGKLQTAMRTDRPITETWNYTYNTPDANHPDAPPQVRLVTLSRTGGTTSGLVEQTAYTYYGSSDPNGNFGDLKTAQLQDVSGHPLSTYYYRYYTAIDA